MIFEKERMNLIFLFQKYRQFIVVYDTLTDILKSVHTDYIYHRTDHPGWVLGHPFQKWFEPIGVTFAV